MTSLKERLSRPGPLLVGGAHDALSAKLVQEAGFDAIWASGFEISASHGVPDANILTMTDNLLAAGRMARVVGIPIIADCDNGYGNAINVIHTVREYEREGIAAICIETTSSPSAARSTPAFAASWPRWRSMRARSAPASARGARRTSSSSRAPRR